MTSAMTKLQRKEGSVIISKIHIINVHTRLKDTLVWKITGIKDTNNKNFTEIYLSEKKTIESFQCYFHLILEVRKCFSLPSSYGLGNTVLLRLGGKG